MECNERINGLRHELPTYLHPHYLRALQHSTADPIGLLTLTKDRHQATLAFAIRRTPNTVHLYSPYGASQWAGAKNLEPLAPCFLEFCEAIDATTVYHPCGFHSGGDHAFKWFFSEDVFPHYTHYFWPLTGTPSDKLKNSHPTHRRLMKQWTEQRPRWCLHHQKLQRAFLQLYPPFIQSKKANTHYHFHQDTLSQWLQAPQTLLVGCEHEGSIEAVGWYWINGAQADYFLFASTPDGRRHGRAIHYMAAELAQQLGCTEMNLGGGITPNDALARFKRHFGTEARQSWVAKSVINSDAFQRLGGVPAQSFERFPRYTGFPSYCM